MDFKDRSSHPWPWEEEGGGGERDAGEYLIGDVVDNPGHRI